MRVQSTGYLVADSAASAESTIVRTMMTTEAALARLGAVQSVLDVFEVTVNDRTLYSKKATGQFPDPDALFREVQGLR